MKIRCYEGRNEYCKESEITGERFKSDKMDLLIFTDRSANEECSDVGAAFVVRKIKNGQIWKLWSEDYRFDSNKIRSRKNITTKDLKEDNKNYYNYQIIKFKIYPKSNNWQQMRTVLKDSLQKLTEQKKNVL